jgi:hypothetical protein
MCLRPTQCLRCGRNPLRQGYHAIAGKTSSISDIIMSLRHHANDNFVEQLLKGGTDASGLEPGEDEAEEVDYSDTDEEIRAAQGHGHADRGRHVGRWAACTVLAPQLHLEAKLDVARQQHPASKLSPWRFHSLLREMFLRTGQLSRKQHTLRQPYAEIAEALTSDPYAVTAQLVLFMYAGHLACLSLQSEAAASFFKVGSHQGQVCACACKTHR